MSFTRRSSTTLQVTRDDVGQYYCLVYKPGQMLAEGKVSMPTELVIIEASTLHVFTTQCYVKVTKLFYPA